MKKILFAGALAGLLVACEDSTTSPQPEPRTSDVTEISSSSETVENSSQKSGESSSSEQGVAESSSSQETVIVESSSSEQGVAESSSSQETVIVESSSSAEIAPQDTASQKTVLDSLPFDTTGIQPELLKYTIDPDTYTDEDRAKMGPYLGHNITVEEWTNPTCEVIHVYESGKIVTDFAGYHEFWNCVLVVLDDSLMFSNAQKCRNTPIWGSCRNAEAYSKKIVVGGNVFYFGVFEQQLQLTQVTDTSLTIWLTKNPDYVVPDSVAATRTWKKSVFKDDSLVKFVGESRNPDYVDTIAIEKYNVTITDWGNTWIFANETCSSEGYVKDTTKTAREQCKDWQTYRNDFVDCTARNMNLPKGVYPRLCRPTKIDNRYGSVWCILDGDYVAPEE